MINTIAPRYWTLGPARGLIGTTELEPGVKQVRRTHGLGPVRLTKGNIGAGAQFADDDSRVSYARRGLLLLPRHGRLLRRPSRDLLGGGAGVASGDAGGRRPAGRAAHGERPRQCRPTDRRSDAAVHSAGRGGRSREPGWPVAGRTGRRHLPSRPLGPYCRINTKALAEAQNRIAAEGAQ